MPNKFTGAVHDLIRKDCGEYMKTLKQLFRDESGGEIMEYVLIAGLIIVGCIAVIGAFGGKVLARWNSVNSGL